MGRERREEGERVCSSVLARTRADLVQPAWGGATPSSSQHSKCSAGPAGQREGLVGESAPTSARSHAARRAGWWRASFALRARGVTARHEDLSAAASTTLERSASTVAHGTRTMRERRRRRATVSRERRGRASGSLARGRTDARGVPACRPCLARPLLPLIRRCGWGVQSSRPALSRFKSMRLALIDLDFTPSIL